MGGDDLLTTDQYRSIDLIMGTIMGIKPDMLQKLEEKKSIICRKNKNNHRPLHTISLLNDVLNTTRKKQINHEGDNNDDDDLMDKKYRFYVAWDFQSTYRGMELYTISWEQNLLLELSGLAKDIQKDLVKEGAKYIVKKTVLATLYSAVAIPRAMLKLTGFIDEKWWIVNERADEAGILLAESLLT